MWTTTDFVMGAKILMMDAVNEILAGFDGRDSEIEVIAKSCLGTGEIREGAGGKPRRSDDYLTT